MGNYGHDQTVRRDFVDEAPPEEPDCVSDAISQSLARYLNETLEMGVSSFQILPLHS